MPVRQLSEWVAAGFFIVVSLLFLLLTGLNDGLEKRLRLLVSDVTAPVLATVIIPFEEAVLSVETIASWFSLMEENQALRSENQRLRHWYQTALSLEAEKKQLSGLLHLKNEGIQAFLTTRLITDPSQPLFQNVLVPVGSEDGLSVGHAALADGGLIGRVVDVGRHSARVLMVTDINSRIPVFIGANQQRAILAGDNTSQPILDHLSRDISLKVGERVITSGQGGLFKPGLAIGEVDQVDGTAVRVKLYVDFQTLDYIRIADYGLIDPLD